MKSLKFFTTLFVCFSLISSTYDPPQAEAQMAGAVLILGCTVIAACIIIKAMAKPNGAYDRVLVLELSHYDGNWTPIATNFHAYLNPENPVTIFAPQMTDDIGQYRVKDITDEWRKIHPYLYQTRTY